MTFGCSDHLIADCKWCLLSAENPCFQKYDEVGKRERRIRHRVIMSSLCSTAESWKGACSFVFGMILCLFHILLLNKLTLTRKV